MIIGKEMVLINLLRTEIVIGVFVMTQMSYYLFLSIKDILYVHVAYDTA